MLACTGLAEESIERVITATESRVTRHLTIGLDSMFKTVQLPTSVANLNTGLTNMN
jgi:hypothetical protein